MNYHGQHLAIKIQKDTLKSKKFAPGYTCIYQPLSFFLSNLCDLLFEEIPNNQWSSFQTKSKERPMRKTVGQWEKALAKSWQSESVPGKNKNKFIAMGKLLNQKYSEEHFNLHFKQESLQHTEICFHLK